MVEKELVAWDVNDGFRKLKACNESFRITTATQGSRGLTMRQLVGDGVYNFVNFVLYQYYGKAWVDKYGDEAKKQIEQGILDK